MLITIFDKSFIHGITADEAAVFDMHFMSNITPLFYVEVLADLEKSGATDEKRAAIVRNLAGKTPVYQAYPNIPHPEIVFQELLGHSVERWGVPIVGGGRRVQTADGLGTVIDEPPEMKAMSRWQSGFFEGEEYATAKLWREMLKTAPDGMDEFTGGTAGRFTFRDLTAIKKFADKLIDSDGARFKTLKGALQSLRIPPQFHERIIARWKTAGGPRLRDFVPYTAHILSVDLFRILGMASGHIDPDKTSNYADMAYLYYVPFCEVFISTDKLHKRCAPLFMSGTQQFLWGPDLRPHLSQLVAEYLSDPNLEELGLTGIASRKVFGKDSYIGALYERFHPARQRRPSEPRLTPEAEKKLVDHVKSIQNAPSPEAGTDLSAEDQAMSLTRMVPIRRGRFPMMSRKVLEKELGTDK